MDDAAHILSLNCKAVNALIGGCSTGTSNSSSSNYGEAAALLLREALRLIEMPDEEYVFRSCTNQQQHQQSFALAILPVHLSSQQTSCCPQTSAAASPSYCYGGGGDQSSFFLYDRAFLIVPQVVNNTSYDSNNNNNNNSSSKMILNQEQRIRISTVLLFNLALCFHLQGMKNVKVRDRCFREANTFYLMSYGLLDPTSSSQADILLQLALLNNRGAICYNFQDIQEAQQCLDDLRFALDDLMDNYYPPTAAVDSLSSSCSFNAVSNEDCVLFFKSILYNGRLDARAAPVA